MKKLAIFLSICVLSGTLSSCGGGSGGSASAATPGAATGVTGVATPTAISVVTAK